MAIGYYGGKAGSNGKWVCSMLPPVEPRQCYIETHAGMLGVLLRREQAAAELVSDLNGRIVNWWLVARDRNDDLIDALRWTPRSERLFDDALATIDEGDDLERAIKLSVVLTQGRRTGDTAANSWSRRYTWTYKAEGWIRSIESLRERIVDVQFFNEPATAMLDRVKKKSNAVIYVDPPYRSANTEAYAIDQQDYEDTVRLLREQAGKVAVSGYHDDWDALGWHRYEKEVRSSVGDNAARRVEVLWTNYKVEGVDTCTALPEPQSAPLLF